MLPLPSAEVSGKERASYSLHVLHDMLTALGASCASIAKRASMSEMLMGSDLRQTASAAATLAYEPIHMFEILT